MRVLRQSTVVTVQLGAAVDSTDGSTPEVGLSPTVYLSKGGAAQAARTAVGAIAHDRDGYYRVPLDATDTNTLGHLIAQFTAGATHRPVREDFHVVPDWLYDRLHSTDDAWVELAGLATAAQRSAGAVPGGGGI